MRDALEGVDGLRCRKCGGVNWWTLNDDGETESLQCEDCGEIGETPDRPA